MVVSPSTNLKSYENTTMGISIEYPDNWNYEEEGDEVIFNPPGGLVSIAVYPSIYSSSQEAVINFTNIATKEVSGFNLIQFEPVDLRGVNFTSSNHLVFTENSDFGSIYKENHIITVFGGKMYLIQYLADPAVYPIFEPTIQRMIDSFQITDTPDTTAAGSPTPTPTPTPTATPAPLLLSSKFGLDKIQDIRLENGTSYPIKYKITSGQVTTMELERTSTGKPSLIIDIVPEVSEDTYEGNIVLEIPNMVLDPNRNFVVYEDVSPTEWKELARDPHTVIIEAAFSNYSTKQRIIEIGTG